MVRALIVVGALVLTGSEAEKAPVRWKLKVTPLRGCTSATPECAPRQVELADDKPTAVTLPSGVRWSCQVGVPEASSEESHRRLVRGLTCTADQGQTAVQATAEFKYSGKDVLWASHALLTLQEKGAPVAGLELIPDPQHLLGDLR